MAPVLAITTTCRKVEPVTKRGGGALRRKS